MTERSEHVVAQAIDAWYTANYPLGVRLSFGQRAALAASINYRLGIVKRPITEDGPAWRVNR